MIVCMFCRATIDGRKHNPYRCQQNQTGSSAKAHIAEARELLADAQAALQQQQVQPAQPIEGSDRSLTEPPPD